MIERKIIIGLIVSSEFCQKIKEIWNVRLIESGTAKLLSNWIWEYYNKYNKAPGKDIEAIYYTKIKETKVQRSLAEEIEQDILPGLSDEYENEDFNLEYLLEESTKYLNEQHIKLFTDTIQSLLSDGKQEDAEDQIRKFLPLEIVNGNLNKFIITADQIRNKNIRQPTLLLKPWLREGQTTIIYAGYGTGKSLLVILISYLLGMRIQDSEMYDVGEWVIKNPTGCLYLDGEMGEKEMEERISQFEWLGRQKHKIHIFSVPEYQLETEDPFYLSTRPNQLKVLKWLKAHPDYKLVVLDSATTLFGLLDENSNSEWNNKINPFLRDLRALGVAHILLHHAGKDSKKGLRGASSSGAMAHNIFRLINHKNRDIDAGEAWFVITKDKQRSAGKLFGQFALRFTQSDNKKETHWEVTKDE